MHSVIERNQTFFSEAEVGVLLAQLKRDFKNYKSINFYDVQVEKQLEYTASLVITYKAAIRALSDWTETRPSSPEQTRLLQQFKNILTNLSEKESRLARLKEQIPRGMLDVKRALTVTGSLSESEEENTELFKLLSRIKIFLIQINTDYTALIQQKNTLNDLLWTCTSFYWKKLAEYKTLLETSCRKFSTSALTESGLFTHECLTTALTAIPYIPEAVLSFESFNNKKRTRFMKKNGFFSPEAVACSNQLSSLGKEHFLLPHHNDRYHFDYDPTADLCETGGDCFGQSMAFITSLVQGDFKILRPPVSLINYQLDQNRPWDFYEKKLITKAETEVSAESRYSSLQWRDLKKVFTNEAGFLYGSVCGLHFSMNEYTRSARDFVAGHILAVAKLDPTRSPYKYILYEKEFGVFGLKDEQSLEIVMKAIMAMYEGMNYSIAKVTQYAEASLATYELMNTIPSIRTPLARADFHGTLFSAPRREEVSLLAEAESDSEELHKSPTP